MNARKHPSPPPATDHDRGRVHLLWLGEPVQWSLVCACLSVDDLRAALGVGPGASPSDDDMDLAVAAQRRLRTDPRVCRALQAALDKRSQEALGFASSCADRSQLLAWWVSGRHQARAPEVYWAVISQARLGEALRHSVFKGFCADRGLGRSRAEADALPPGLLSALRQERERTQALQAALQVESARRRMLQQEVDALRAATAAGVPQLFPPGVPAGELHAFPVDEWQVLGPLGREGRSAIRMSDLRGQETAFTFDLDELMALHTAIGDQVTQRRHIGRAA